MDIINSMPPILVALCATIFTWGLTALGAGLVFFLKKSNNYLMDALLGISGGVMVAASIFSLIIPSLEASEKLSFSPAVMAVVGVMIGGITMWLLDRYLPHKHQRSGVVEGADTEFKDSTLLFLAITLHNIPEGLAIGVAIGSASLGYIPMSAALLLAIGIGIQNFPEGAAVSLPMFDRGTSKWEAFKKGQGSALVEIPAALFGVMLAESLDFVLPLAMTFAAGAMLYVVVEELIPESQASEHNNVGTMSFLIGFCIMMFLDVALG